MNSINQVVHQDNEKTQLGTWLFLFTELVVFGGLFLVYAFNRLTNAQEFQLAAKELNTFLGTINTIMLLTGGLTTTLGIIAIKKDQKFLSLLMQIVTLVIAIGVVSNVYVDYSNLSLKGLLPGSALLAKSAPQNLFFVLYFSSVIVVAVLIIVGMLLSLTTIWATYTDSINIENHKLLETIGLYLQSINIVWILFFVLFFLVA